ncbi:MAG: diaminopimelate epimerase [Proteobacteria bacterium]|nr:diaminopimelate epimerase [Pseudomonadota bacterium]
MQFSYLKMHGAGNRIVVVDVRDKNSPIPTPEQLILLGDEATGPGFDQLMWVMSAANSDMAASYRVFNADGSEVEQCGNGVRCVAWMLAQEDGAPSAFMLDSPAGPIEVRMMSAGQFSTNMGAPEFEPKRIPFVADARATGYTLEVAGRNIDVTVVSMGNPHCVIQVENPGTADVEGIGALIEHHERFPEGCNVGFMAVRGRGEIDLRVFERGVGETLACGTGACAAMIAARQVGMVDDEVRVNLPGGQLVVNWQDNADTVWLTGNAEFISEGTIDL